MPQVQIVKGFILTHDRTTVGEDNPNMWGKEEYIPPGVYDFSESVANNWFVQAHSNEPPAALPKPGTPEWGAKAQAAERRRMLVAAAIEQEAADAGNAIRRDALVTGRFGQVEEDVHAEESEEADRVAREAAINEAARTGAKVALPVRRPLGTGFVPSSVAAPKPATPPVAASATPPATAPKQQPPIAPAAKP